MYQVKYQDFEGPLDLLLDLMEKKKLDITQLSLAKVADDYLGYMEEKDNIDIANLSSFLLTASQLILLKSKALLPLFEFSQEEEEEIENLQQRLKEHQKFRKAADSLKRRLAEKKIYFSKEQEVLDYKKFIPVDCQAEDLKNIFKNILQSIPQNQPLEEEVMKDVISLEDKISQIKGSLQKRISIAFKETIQDAEDKMELIISFLAILEMVKQKLLFAKQQKNYCDIMLSKKILKEK